MKANRELQRYGRAGSRPTLIPTAGEAHFAGFVELGNAAKRDHYALCTRMQGLCRAHVWTIPQRDWVEALERRRPKPFGGMGALLDRELRVSELARCTTKLIKSLLRGMMAGALWTANTANRRGLRRGDRCLYYDKGSMEDEDHFILWCTCSNSARDPFLPDLMLLARAHKLGALSKRPPCLCLCRLLPEAMATRSGLARGLRWNKRRGAPRDGEGQCAGCDRL